ncbi:MAG: DUF6326 family protein [Pseudomonadota bacterium]
MSLETNKTPTPIKLSLLWGALMGLYIYNDYFMLYMPGKLESMQNGIMGPLGEATDQIMIGVSLMLAVPALMIFLSAGLPSRASQILNVVFGVVYTLINGLTFFGSYTFYQIVVVLEIAVTLSIIWSALRWPQKA